MRFPRGSASSVLSLAAGVITAAAVAVAWFPMLRASNEAEQAALSNRLELVARMAGLRIRQQTGAEGAPSDLALWQSLEADLEAVEEAAGLDLVMVMDAAGRPTLGSARSEVAPDRIEDVVDAARRAAARCRGLDPAAGSVETTVVATPSRPVAAACAPLEGGTTLVVASDSRQTGALTEARRRATPLLLGLGALAGLVVMAGTRWLLAPIQELSEAAARIAAGERQVQVEPRGPEEIAQLGHAVNALARSFEAREDEIRGRLNVVTQLSSMVAHEVRNPLQSLSLLVTLARTENDEATRNKLLLDVEAEIHVLEGVVQRFLRNSGPLQISRARTDLVEVVKRAVAVAEPEARSRKISLLVQAPGKLEIDIDGSLVRRAMENLLFNALEFASQQAQGHVAASVIPQTRQVLLIVDDDGPGVPPPDRERIFQPYFSSKAGGTGLGLALVKQVFEAHGGYIHCQDSPLGGARFVAGIPLPSAKDLGS